MNLQEVVNWAENMFGPDTEVIVEEDDMVSIYTKYRAVVPESDGLVMYSDIEVTKAPDCGDPGPDCVEHNGACD